MKPFQLLGAAALILVSLLSSGQPASIEGYWSGALIRTGNSIQLLNIEINNRADSLVGELAIPDWPRAGSRLEPVKMKDNVVYMDTPYGNATLVLDSVYGEMTGVVEGAIPPLNIHLKRAIPPVNVELNSEELTVRSEGLEIAGTLYYPAGSQKKLSAAILVPGRGCAFAARARFIARRGMATFVYDKRGGDASGFPCNSSTHELEVNDLVELIREVKKNPKVEKSRVGLLSVSAGAWTSDAASAVEDVAFMIQFVGPATSIREQQFDGIDAFAEDGRFEEKYVEEAKRYTELLYSREMNENKYKELQSLLASARESGWDDWLAPSDIPESMDRFDEIWVQRFQYDPTGDLSRFEGPFLSVLGEVDPVVPLEIQVNRFDSIFGSAGKSNYEIRVIPEASHGLGRGSEVRNLGYNETTESTTYYYKFYRSGVEPMTYTLDFLEEYGFIE